MVFGLTPLLVIVIVVPVVPPPPPPLPPPDGAVLDPPQLTVSATAAALRIPQTNLLATRISTPHIPLADRQSCLSIKLPRDVEPQIPVVRRRAAARDLTHRRPECVREVQLEDVAARALLDAEAPLMVARFVPRHARRELADDVHRGPHAHPRAEADHERVVLGNRRLLEQVGVMREDRLGVECRLLADSP